MNWYKRQLKIAMPRGFSREWTDEELEKIKELILNGETAANIAKMFGTSKSVILRLNYKYKWREKKPFSHVKEFSSDEIEVIKSLIEEGYSYNDIGSLLNVSRYTIQKINDEHGWREKFVPKDLSSYKDKVLDLYLNQGLGTDLISQYFNGEIKNFQVKAILRREGVWKGWDPVEVGEKVRKNRWERIGGWDKWISQYSPEKRKEIQDAMHYREQQRQEGQYSV